MAEEEDEVLALIKASSSGTCSSSMNHWGYRETSHLIAIKSEIPDSSMFLPQNEEHWGLVSARMAEMGICVSPEQCENCWKSLESQYKTAVTMENPSGNFAYYNQMQGALMRIRQREMTKMKAKVEVSDENDDSQSVKTGRIHRSGKKRKADQQQQQQRQRGNTSNKPSGAGGSMQEILMEFMRQQRLCENSWRRSVEERERARIQREEEWMRRMENVERERLRMECMFREREEERRAKQEALSQKRDSLLTTLLTNLIQQDKL